MTTVVWKLLWWMEFTDTLSWNFLTFDRRHRRLRHLSPWNIAIWDRAITVVGAVVRRRSRRVWQHLCLGSGLGLFTGPPPTAAPVPVAILARSRPEPGDAKRLQSRCHLVGRQTLVGRQKEPLSHQVVRQEVNASARIAPTLPDPIGKNFDDRLSRAASSSSPFCRSMINFWALAGSRTHDRTPASHAAHLVFGQNGAGLGL